MCVCVFGREEKKKSVFGWGDGWAAGKCKIKLKASCKVTVSTLDVKEFEK